MILLTGVGAFGGASTPESAADTTMVTADTTLKTADAA